MPIHLSEEDGGKLLVVQLTGKLTANDYTRFVPEFDRHLGLHGKLRVLFDMTGLHGWDAGAMWEDAKFGVNHFSAIERIAMVGENQWQHGMAIICKPFTAAKVKYFDHADATQAREWLNE